jgi:effector-binding domain-containing protein
MVDPVQIQHDDLVAEAVHLLGGDAGEGRRHVGRRYSASIERTETGGLRRVRPEIAEVSLDHGRFRRICSLSRGVRFTARGRRKDDDMIRILALAAILAFAGAATAQQPTLPPPGGLVTPPAAPNPAQPPAAPPQAPSADQNRMPEIGGPSEVVLMARPVLLLKGQSNWDDGFDNLTEAFRKLRDEAARHKLGIAGRPQAAFTSTDDFGFKFEAMMVLEGEAPAQRPPLSKDFDIGQSPAGKALKFTHAGAYDDIDTTYEAITAYLDEKGLKARNLFVEEYLTDPKTSEDPELQMNILVLIE